MNLHKYFHSFVTISIVFGVTLLTTFAAQSVLAQNPTADENNNHTGTTSWRILAPRGALEHEIEGYASATSINKDESINFYVNVAVSQSVTIEIYRMGHYGGTYGRLIETLSPVQVFPQLLSEADYETGLIECNWAMTKQWTPPEGTVSGYFLAKLVGTDKDSYIIFVVRDDDRTSDFIFQSAVTTYQAYNKYPGNFDVKCPHDPTITCPSWYSGKSLYRDIGSGFPVPDEDEENQDTQARKVSFNRPYYVGGDVADSAGHFFQWEYHMMRWMENNDLDVTYITNIDTHHDKDNFGIGKHKAFLTAGHDEYYSWEMRDNLEQARNRTSEPLNLGFFSSNDAYWQIRLAPSSSINTTPASEPNRTIICYKTHINDPEYGDPNVLNDAPPMNLTADNYEITGLWRQNFDYPGPCADGTRNCFKKPEDELVGAMTDQAAITGSGNFTFGAECPSNCWVRDDVGVRRFPDLVSYEPVVAPDTDYLNRERMIVGNSILSNGARAHAVYFRMKYEEDGMETTFGGRVFSIGSNQWAWGLDNPEYDQTEDVGIMTMNILDCFNYGGEYCGDEK